MFYKRKGMTLVEVILAIALLGLISVSLITGFSSQLININRGTDITVQAMDAQSIFEDVIFDVKTKIQDHQQNQPLDDLMNALPEWTYESVTILGESFNMQKISKSYSEDVKENTIYLSRRLAEIEKRPRISISGVLIDVSTDANDLVADLSLSPLPTLKAVHDDNTSEIGFYVNLYRWWKSVPGKDIASLRFPDDFSLVNVSQTTDILTNLLDNVGAGRYVALTVTPVDIHGFRGNTLMSSNYVFVKGAEWRIGSFPWADTNNDYNLDGNDVIIDTNRIKEELNASVHNIPNFLDPTEMLSIKNSSLFIPMNIAPGGGPIPGDLPMLVDGTQVINWLIENSIHIAKDINITNGTDVNIFAGTDDNGGSVYLYPYVQLDGAGNPVTINGAPVIINYGASITTDGNINIKTLSRGDIELLNYNTLEGNNITLETRGSIRISSSSLYSDNDIIFDTLKNPEIAGDRSVMLESTLLSSTNPNSKVRFDTKDDILFKGGGWSSNQTLYIPDGKNILFSKGASKISNSGIIDLGSFGRMYFKNSMIEDLARSIRIRLEKNSNDSFEIATINYKRNLNYANTSINQKVVLPGLWNKLGAGNHNFEFSTRVISGPGNVDDLAYSYEGNGIIRIHVTTAIQRANTRVKFDIRDRFNNETIGHGYFVYSVDSSGISNIEVEQPPPLDYYTITFNTNGGSVIAPISGYVDDNVGTITEPTRIGHIFSGWDKPIPAKIPEYDLELNAIWEAIDYRITFNSNGGLPISDMRYKYGEQISIPNPTRVGYTFAGWNTTPPEYMPAEDLHFEAQWTNNTLTITFDSNGGTSVNPNSMQVLFDSPYGPLPTPIRDYYNFTGWYTGLINGSLVEATTIVNITDNHTLFAMWESASISVDAVYLLDTADGQFKTSISKEIRRNNLPPNIPLEHKIMPENATNKTVTWSSSNNSIATVDSSGVVTFGNNIGDVTITVTTNNGKTATLRLRITNSSGC